MSITTPIIEEDKGSHDKYQGDADVPHHSWDKGALISNSSDLGSVTGKDQNADSLRGEIFENRKM